MPRESGAFSNHRVVSCAPIAATWLLDRPLSRAMTRALYSATRATGAPSPRPLRGEGWGEGQPLVRSRLTQLVRLRTQAGRLGRH
jgi:hypothetical protein